jgi:transposase-like protein
MITRTLRCHHCQSEDLVRNGHTAKGKQKYLCRSCGRQSRDDPQSNAYSAKRRQEILSTYQEGSSLRSISRIFGVSRNTVTAWLKESEAAEPDDKRQQDSLQDKDFFDFLKQSSRDRSSV